MGAGCRLTIQLHNHLMLHRRANHCTIAQHNMRAKESSDKTTPVVPAAWELTFASRRNVMLREFAV